MKMTFRWYGSAIDPIPLKYVKQIPGMTGLMGLLDKSAGVDWPGSSPRTAATVCTLTKRTWARWVRWRSCARQPKGCIGRRIGIPQRIRVTTWNQKHINYTKCVKSERVGMIFSSTCGGYFEKIILEH